MLDRRRAFSLLKQLSEKGLLDGGISKEIGEDITAHLQDEQEIPSTGEI